VPVQPPQHPASYENPSNFIPGGVAEPNILQVYAAYETGLAHGTSVRIKVSYIFGCAVCT
jgi:hypothetical protein